jgi:hypothetical protein
MEQTMKTSQTIQSRDDKIGNLKARQFHYDVTLAENADLNDPKSTPYRLTCVDEDNPKNCEDLGSFGSLSGAQQFAEQHLKGDRSNPPTLIWT